MTPLQNLYDAFFVILESDEWDLWDEQVVNQDLLHLFRAAVPWFKFPRCSLELDSEQKNFVDPRVGNTELQILALFMKDIWYGRVIESWENLRPAYAEVDFSPASQQREYTARQKALQSRAEKLESIYYRSVDGKSYDYGKLAGG